MISPVVLLFIALLPLISFASSVYYPTDFKKQIAKHEIVDQELKDDIFVILTSSHTRLPTGDDVLGCNQRVGTCFSHQAVGYSNARKYLYTQLHVQTDSRGKFLKEVYCNHEQIVPINENTINCEHTWPQSKFTSAFDNETQKSDLHHLFPSDSKANSIRGNMNFTDVSFDNGSLDSNCSASKFGSSAVKSNDGFEPPLTHKGNVARALFYFSVRYKITIPKTEEDVLRRWNDLDPVDQEEMHNNDLIEQVQKNRNPFVDFPSLANDITKF